MNKQELKKLAQKYLSGEASEAEKAMLHQWYDANMEGWTETVQTENGETAEAVKERIFNNLKRKTFMQEEADSRTGAFSLKKILLRLSGAAALLTVGFFAWQFYAPQTGTHVKQQVSVPVNKIMEIVLPDSSKVWLNAGSVFKYPKKFDREHRIVELIEGRAFFEVKHEDKHPFIVKTDNLSVVVMGTSFDVRAYKNEGTTKVSVVTGKVGVTLKDETKKAPIFLLPKQQVVLSNLKNHLVKAAAPEIAVNSWCSSRLVFEQETLGNIFSVLEKKYNVKIAAEEELLNERISITLDDQKLDIIMNILSFAKHFKYQIANDKITVIR